MKPAFLYLLIILGVCLRLALFAGLPASLNRDEAALGYNAFALATEGIDEWGESYPLLFRSFGDYKLPGYIYTLVPLVKVFGLSEWVVRLPSLMAGLGLIYLTYLIVQKIGSNRETALFSASLVAISPWPIFYSRVAFEANLALAFFLTAGYCLATADRKRIGLGLVFFLLAILTYNTPLLLTPILIWLILRQKITPWQKFLPVALITLIAGGWLMAGSSLTAQKGQITIFANSHLSYLQQEAYLNAVSLPEKILSSRYVYYPILVLKNTAHWLAPDFLVARGGENPWHSLPGRGHLYYVVYVLGIFQIINMLRWRKFKLLALTFALLAIAIVPSILTVDSPHATRSLLGLWFVLLMAGQAWQVKPVRWFIAVALIAEVAIFGYQYFHYFPKHHAPEWQVGLRESIRQVEITYPVGPIAIINPYDQPYIYTLFYTQTPPRTYHESVERYGRDSAGQEKVKSFGRWQFIGDPKDVAPGIPIIYRDSHQIYHIIDNNKKL